MNILNAYERGVDDGFFHGSEAGNTSDWTDEMKDAYNQGYEHGVHMYAESIRSDACLSNALDALYTALPFVEDHEGSEVYKEGAVSAALKKIHKAIKQLSGEENA